MENASKALLMAAEILIALIIISLGVALFTAYRGTAENYEEQMSVKEIEAFNNKFLRYIEENNGKKYITAQDLITIVNLAMNMKKNEQANVVIKSNNGSIISESDILKPDATDAMYMKPNLSGEKRVFPVYYIIDANENDWIQYDSIGRVNSIKINIIDKYYKDNDEFKKFQ